MIKDNRERYIRYKKKQELLNRKQVNLILDKDIAETLQRYTKRHKRVMFEYQLKSHFLKKLLIDILHSHCKTDETIPHINILITELQQEVHEMNCTMNGLQK